MSPVRRRILYVDDEIANLIVFESAFEELFDIAVAASAAQALEMVNSESFPVVVADQRMPEMTGVELFRQLRETAPQTQRVILSGYSESGALIDAINDGAIFQFVRKPWEYEDLLSVLLRALEAHDLQVQNSALQTKLVFLERSAMLGQSAARITHELGNHANLLPLIEAIEDEYPEDQHLQDLARIARMTQERLLELIDEIRSFLRPDACMPASARFSLAGCLRELLAFLRFHSVIDVRRIVLEIQQDATVLGHHVKLQQILINLLKNGIEAMQGNPAGVIQLTLSRFGQTAMISVRDNGTGIPEEIRPKIWDPFFSTKGPHGTGLGLDVVKTIVEAHRGVIDFESHPDWGTEFRILLPVADLPSNSISDIDPTLRHDAAGTTF